MGWKWLQLIGGGISCIGLGLMCCTMLGVEATGEGTAAAGLLMVVLASPAWLGGRLGEWWEKR